MQFQAELHLYDSFNESLRQVMDVEKRMHDIKREPERKSPQNEDVKVEESENQVQVGENRTTAAAAAANDDTAEKC